MLCGSLHPAYQGKSPGSAGGYLSEQGALTKIGLILSVIFCVFAAGCGRGGTNAVPPPTPLCSVTQLEAAMDTTLAQATSEVDFSFSVERQDGRRYNFNRGVSTLQTSYESASTSKLVSAVIILRLVEQGHLSLADQPQDWIST
jgi:CubicO group peptidase (beta-lactamase class C family)